MVFITTCAWFFATERAEKRATIADRQYTALKSKYDIVPSDIEYEREIAHGMYGEVWKGKYVYCGSHTTC